MSNCPYKDGLECSEAYRLDEMCRQMGRIYDPIRGEPMACALSFALRGPCPAHPDECGRYLAAQKHYKGR